MNAATLFADSGRSLPRAVLRSVAVIALYYGTARLGLVLAIPHTADTPVWPPSGVAMASIALFGWEVAPALPIASLLVNVTVDIPIPVALGIAAGNTAEYLLGGYFLRRVDFRATLERPSAIAHLALLAAGVAPLVAAFCGPSVEWADGLVSAGKLPQLWMTWWAGDACGVILVVPLLLLLRDGPLHREAFGPFRWEQPFALAAFALASVLVLDSSTPIGFVVFALGTFLAIRLRTIGAIGGSVILWTAAVVTTHHGVNAFQSVGPSNERLLVVDAFAGAFTIMTYALAAASNARVRSEHQVQADNVALEAHVTLIERMTEESIAERERSQLDHDRLQAQLHQSLRLESLGKLAGGIAHDFNNLMAVILNYATFLTKRLGSETAPAPQGGNDERATVLSDVVQIRLAAERAARLTRQLLTFARRDTAVVQVVRLDSVLAEIVELLRGTLGEHIALVFFPSEEPLPVRVDPGQLERVIINLAVNARDAMPGGGRLTLICDAVDVGPDDARSRPGLSPGRCARLRVVDDGMGMSEEVLLRAFDPFFSTKPAGEGSGLGLATVYGVVTEARGQVTISSSEGHGTTVTALIPLAEELSGDAVERDAPLPPDGSAAPPHDGPASPFGSGPHRLGAAAEGSAAADPHAALAGGGRSVLLVEDEAPLLDSLGRLLGDLGFEVLTADGGRQAARMAADRREPLDLLLTDVLMPGMSGPQVAAEVHRLHPESRIIFMSGNAEAAATGGSAAPDGPMLRKPFTIQELAQAIQAAGS